MGRARDRGRRRRRARRRRGGRGRRPAARHGLPRRRRRGRAAGAAVERHPLRRRRRRPGRASSAAAQAWADAVGVVPVASLHGHQAALARRPRAGARRPHRGRLPAARLADLAAHRRRRPRRRSPPTAATPAAPATGRPATGDYRPDLLELAFGARPLLPAGARPGRARRATHRAARVLGAGAGDNAAAALGLGAGPGDVVRLDRHLRRGHRGRRRPARATPTGTVAGFADATGRFLPLVCTLNAARVLDATARLLGVDHDRLADLALSAPAGADGLVLVPYLEGERTPNLPDATGALHGLTLAQPRPRPTSPGPRSRACSAGSPTASTRCVAQGVDAAPGPAGRRRRRVRGGAPDRPGGPRPARSWCRSRGSTSPTAPAGRRPGR